MIGNLKFAEINMSKTIFFHLIINIHWLYFHETKVFYSMIKDLNSMYIKVMLSQKWIEKGKMYRERK